MEDWGQGSDVFGLIHGGPGVDANLFSGTVSQGRSTLMILVLATGYSTWRWDWMPVEMILPMPSSIHLAPRRHTVLDSVAIAFRCAPIGAFFYGLFDLAWVALTPVITLVAARLIDAVVHTARDGAPVDAVYRCLVLDGGRIVKAGSHAELMQAGGLYARMFQAQATWYERKDCL
jgi:hypothetical protein